MPKKTLNKLIESELSDPEIRNNKEFKAILSGFKNDLNNGLSPGLVSRKLNNYITKYLVNHRFKDSQAMLRLSNQLETNDSFFQGDKKTITLDLKYFLQKFHKKNNKNQS